MWLKLVEYLIKGEGPSASIRGGKFGLCVAIVAVVLCYYGRDIAAEQRRQVSRQDARLESAEDVGQYPSDFGQELLVIASDFGPPRIDERP